ncbi:MAG: FHA domain-containing protein [Anaerolineales bacterium]
MGENEFHLRVIKGYEVGKTYPLTEDEITIGRSEDNDITILVPEVSRRHAILTKQDEGYLLRDVGSTNGTFVDRKRVGGKYLLNPGDTVMLGNEVYLKYEPMGEQADPTEVTPPSPMEVPEPPPGPPPEPEVEKAAPPPPAEAEPVRAVPEEEAPEEEKGTRTWLWAGIGCLVVLLFILVVGLIAFDWLDLYCTPPFDALDFLYPAPCQP